MVVVVGGGGFSGNVDDCCCCCCCKGSRLEKAAAMLAAAVAAAAVVAVDAVTAVVSAAVVVVEVVVVCGYENGGGMTGNDDAPRPSLPPPSNGFWSMLPIMPYSNPAVSEPNPRSASEKFKSCEVSRNWSKQQCVGKLQLVSVADSFPFFALCPDYPSRAVKVQSRIEMLKSIRVSVYQSKAISVMQCWSFVTAVTGGVLLLLLFRFFSCSVDAGGTQSTLETVYTGPRYIIVSSQFLPFVYRVSTTHRRRS